MKTILNKQHVEIPDEISFNEIIYKGDELIVEAFANFFESKTITLINEC